MSDRNPLFVMFAILLIAVLAVPLWTVFYFGFYISYENFKVRGHQEFAANGVSQIKPAMEMDQLFADCNHFITYGPHDVPLFNSVAYFGDRYVLTMQVPVKIHDKSNGDMAGEPLFYLNEVKSVSISSSGQVGASFSGGHNFDAKQWRQVYESGGDFDAIGFHVDPTPVPNIQKYADASRQSN